ncbi:MAG: TolB family protein [Actinomycetota bacterium]
MTKPQRTSLQILALIGLAGGIEYYFFRAPDAFGRPARAATAAAPASQAAAPSGLLRDGEKHFKNPKQLSFGGENAEAYWSFDGKQIAFQSTRDGLKTNQIFTMNADGSNVRMVSTGKGRTTCSYFLPDGKTVVYASTHLGGDEPPPPPDFTQGYVWAIYPSYDIFKVDLTNPKLEAKRFTTKKGYDAEATVAPNGKSMVFTSMRNGDLDLYTVDLNGDNVQQVTDELGYDGGAFFSPDSKMICYRAGHPQSDEEKKIYRDLLAKNLVKPSKMELFVMNADGSGRRQVTKNGAANFCPYFTPDGKKLIFSSNMDDPQGRNFELYLINLDGTGLERLTFDPSFDGFPMFSPDGKKLVWASNRNAKQRGETNVFVADWIP